MTGIIAMGHSLGMEVLAEGVETDHQLAFLRDRDCDSAQRLPDQQPTDARGVADGCGTRSRVPTVAV